MKRLTIGLLIASLTACSALIPTPLDMLKPKSGIDVDAQVGKTNQMEESLITARGADNRQTADVISNTDTTSTQAEQINNTNIPWWVALMVAFMRPIVILKEIRDLLLLRDK